MAKKDKLSFHLRPDEFSVQPTLGERAIFVELIVDNKGFVKLKKVM